MTYKLYNVNRSTDLVYTDALRFDNPLRENRSSNLNTVKLHRGVDNQLRFRVFDLDRKPVRLHGVDVIAQLINTENGELVLSKPLTVSTQAGQIQLTVDEGELAPVAPGYYNLTVLVQEAFIPGQQEVITKPLYTDFGNNMVIPVQVTASANPAPVPSVIIDSSDWYTVRTSSAPGDDIVRLRTHSVPAARVRNHINSLHTLGVWATDFTGTLQVLATLDQQPPEDLRRWFPVDITSGTNIIEFDRFTGTTSTAFTANFTWLTFVKTPNVLPPGSPLGSLTLSRFAGIRNPGKFFPAAAVLQANLKFLQAEIRSWVSQTFPDLMTTDQADLCDRDVGLIVQSIQQDLTVGGFEATLRSADAYYNDGDPVLPSGQQSPTAAAFQELSVAIAQVLGNRRISKPRQDPVAARFEDVQNPGGAGTAAQLLRNNQQFLQAEMRAFVNTQFPGLMNADQADLCDRDVGLIIQALANDIQLGGTAQTQAAARAYFNLGDPILPSGQLSPTAQTFAQLAQSAQAVISNTITVSPLQDPLSDFFDAVINPGGFQSSANLLTANRDFLQAEVAQWISDNFPGLMDPQQAELCDRDVGFIIDALAQDLTQGGFAASKLAAEFYFNGGDPVLPSGQQSPTAQSYTQLLTLAQQVIRNQPVTVSQSTQTQVFVADQTFTVTNSGASSYIINGDANPVLQLERGKTYIFQVEAPGHPFWIKTAQTTGTDDAFTDGVFNNGTDSGVIVFTVPETAPDDLFYICEFHGSMTGSLQISGTGAPPDFAAVDTAMSGLIAGINAVIVNPEVPDFVPQVTDTDLTVPDPESLGAIIISLVDALNSVITDPPDFEPQVLLPDDVEDRITVSAIVNQLIAALNSVITDPPPQRPTGTIDKIVLR